MQYTQSLQITAISAWSVLQICDRQARRDCGKLARLTYRAYCFLTSRQARQTYREIWRRLVIAVMMMVAIGLWVVEQLDQYVESCQDKPVNTVAPVVATAPVQPVVKESVPVLTPQKTKKRPNRKRSTRMQRGFAAT